MRVVEFCSVRGDCKMDDKGRIVFVLSKKDMLKYVYGVKTEHSLPY